MSSDKTITVYRIAATLSAPSLTSITLDHSDFFLVTISFVGLVS